MKSTFNIWTRTTLAVIFALAAVFFVSHSAQAVSINEQGTLAAGQTVEDDLIIAGENVVVDGTVDGLVIATGNTVTINGTINGDLFAFGADIVIGPTAVITGNVFSGARSVKTQGQVDGSFFTGTMSLDLEEKAAIARNLFFGGYSFTSAGGSTIGRDLLVGGYQAVLNGSVAQNARIDASAIQVNGNIGGDASFTLSGQGSTPQTMDSFVKANDSNAPEALPAGLTIGPSASIAGKLTYTSPVQYTSGIQSQPAGGVVYQTPVPGTESGQNPSSSNQVAFNRHTILDTIFKFIRNFVMLAIVGLLLVWLAPKLLKKTSAAVQSKPFQSVGVGTLSILIAYPGAFVAALVLIGIAILLALCSVGSLNTIVLGLGLSGLGTALAGFTILLKFVSKCVVAYLVGSLLMNQSFPTLTKGREVWAMVIGVFLFALISALPFIGGIVSLLATLLGLGAIWYGLVSKPVPPVVPLPVENA